MQIVETAYLAPAMCGWTKSAQGPFIDFGGEYDLDHAGRMYMRVAYARELGRFVGMVEPEAIEAVEAQVAERDARIAELEAQIAILEEFKAAATYTVEHLGERVRRKPGRKPAEQAA